MGGVDIDQKLGDNGRARCCLVHGCDDVVSGYECERLVVPDKLISNVFLEALVFQMLSKYVASQQNTPMVLNTTVPAVIRIVRDDPSVKPLYVVIQVRRVIVPR